MIALQTESTVRQRARFVGLVRAEIARVGQRYPLFHSDYESFGVLAEEIAEVFEIVRQREELRDPQALLSELVQVAATALRAEISARRAVDNSALYADLRDMPYAITVHSLHEAYGAIYGTFMRWWQGVITYQQPADLRDVARICLETALQLRLLGSDYD